MELNDGHLSHNSSRMSIRLEDVPESNAEKDGITILTPTSRRPPSTMRRRKSYSMPTKFMEISGLI